MSRPLRLEFPGAVYHVMARGDRRRDIYQDDVDRRVFMQILAREVAQQGWLLYAYCLMGNHYHLLIETPDANLVAGMRRLNGVYTQTFNRRHGLVGHVLQGRYKSIIVERDAYLLELARYVVLNPVRAKMVEHAQDWMWSSYCATAGIVSAPSWLAFEAVISQFGDDLRLARQDYRDFVLAGLRAPSPWIKLRGQIYLGREEFLTAMEAMVVESPRVGVPQCQLYPARPTAESVLDLVSKTFDTDTNTVRERGHQTAFQTWVYLLRRATNLNLREAAQLAGISPGRVSQIQRVMDARTPAPEVAELLGRYKVKA